MLYVLFSFLVLIAMHSTAQQSEAKQSKAKQNINYKKKPTALKSYWPHYSSFFVTAGREYHCSRTKRKKEHPFVRFWNGFRNSRCCYGCSACWNRFLFAINALCAPWIPFTGISIRYSFQKNIPQFPIVPSGSIPLADCSVMFWLFIIFLKSFSKYRTLCSTLFFAALIYRSIYMFIDMCLLCARERVCIYFFSCLFSL